MGRVADWWDRRVVRARPRPHELVGYTSRVTYADYLRDGRFWRGVWIGTAVVEVLVFVGLVGAMLAFPWIRPRPDGTPEIGWLVITVPIALVMGSLLPVSTGSVRAMVREFGAPRRDVGDD